MKKKKFLHLISPLLFADCKCSNKMADMCITQVELECRAPQLDRHLTFNIHVPQQLSFSTWAPSDLPQPSQDRPP